MLHRADQRPWIENGGDDKTSPGLVLPFVGACPDHLNMSSLML